MMKAKNKKRNGDYAGVTILHNNDTVMTPVFYEIQLKYLYPFNMIILWQFAPHIKDNKG